MGKQYQKEIEQILQGAESKPTSKKAGGKASGNANKEVSRFIAHRRLFKLFLLAGLGLLLLSFIGSAFLPTLIVKILIVTATITFLLSYGGLLVTINTKPNR
jgi:hypothetical protein|tara:strand:+ start:4217 stop:4522 length:306 start_codon:yes stop_codon:yes gene_type:complete